MGGGGEQSARRRWDDSPDVTDVTVVSPDASPKVTALGTAGAISSAISISDMISEGSSSVGVAGGGVGARGGAGQAGPEAPPEPESSARADLESPPEAPPEPPPTEPPPIVRLEDATQFAHVHDTATYAAVAELAGVPADALGQVSPPAVFLRKPWDELHAVAELGESARSWESRGGGGRSADELADEEKRFRNAVTELLVAHALPLVVPFSEEFQEAIFMQEVHAAQSAHMYTHTHTSVAGRA